MSRALHRRQTPEEAELARRRLQLSALRAALAEREKALDDQRALLFSFEGRYIRQVGVLYRQLDEWERKIAELNSPLLTPEETAAQEEDIIETSTGSGPEPAEPDAPLDLKLLFRELAKRIHPDFASGRLDEQHRTRLMAQANDAYRRADAGMLQRMLHGHDASVPRQTLAEDLAGLLAQLTEVDRSIVLADREIEALTHSELARLRERTLLAAQGGRDLLAEMAARVKGNIGMAMRRYELDLERRKRKQAAFDPTSLLSAETSSTP